MNKLHISIVVLAALSGAAYANERIDRRDSDTCMGKYCNNVKEQSTSSTRTVVSPLAVVENDSALTNFERMKKISKENEQGGH